MDLEPNSDNKNLDSRIKMITLGSAFPLIAIPNWQFHLFHSTTKGTESVRMLMDFLFEEEAFAEKNCTYIKKIWGHKSENVWPINAPKRNRKAPN